MWIVSQAKLGLGMHLSVFSVSMPLQNQPKGNEKFAVDVEIPLHPMKDIHSPTMTYHARRRLFRGLDAAINAPASSTRSSSLHTSPINYLLLPIKSSSYSSYSMRRLCGCLLIATADLTQFKETFVSLYIRPKNYCFSFCLYVSQYAVLLTIRRNHSQYDVTTHSMT